MPEMWDLLHTSLESSSAKIQGTLTGKDERALLEYLFGENSNNTADKYNPLERPVFNESEPLELVFGLTLMQIIDVDEKNQLLVSLIWLNMEWTDYSMVWDPDDYNQIMDLRIPPKKMWIPDVLMYNSRVTLPLTVEEYQVAQLYAVAEASKNETGGGEGVEVLKNEPFSNFPLLGGRYSTGQYTYKIYRLGSKVPGFIRMIAPKGSLEIHEEAWNAYPYCRTVLTAHQLPPEKLKEREVVKIDIANDPVSTVDYNPATDPAKYHSDRANRGPLLGNWKETVTPIMTCYKLVTCEFKWFGLQNRVESFTMKTERRLFTNFHRQLFCWMDGWYGLTMEDIREMEEKVRQELDEQRVKGTLRGTVAIE
ncbi:unnamed protein product [Cyprideis torosa]|uniref:Uncharacterized protein n=1 Tax=Cyprideis torosa TaxID=163714 RepID=A0A7R8VZX1_9CRUS|nr:unnamed protein product [Cyprideis torosa]CAG0879124.1 unnamed protein product [Cyprideis torosa]